MNNPKTEETVKSLRGCSADVMDCENCVTGSFHRAWCCDTLRLYAADLIEQLRQELIDERYRHDRVQDFCVAQGEELSKLKAQQRWIPVTERLPEDDDDVLIMSSGSISMGYYSTYNEYWADYINVYYNDVTHWMPLPEPPKEEDHDKDIEPELVERVTHKSDAQLRPLQDMDEIKYYMGEEPKE